MAGARLLTSLRALAGRPSIVDAHGAYSYGALAAASGSLAASLAASLPASRADARPPRVAYMCSRDNTYVQAQLAAWASGSIGVPIAENHPPSEIEYVLRDCGASVVLADAAKGAVIGPVAALLGIPHLPVGRLVPCAPSLVALRASATGAALPTAPARPGTFAPDDGALLIYTSGTTGRPKGVLTTHAALDAQVTALTRSWAWTPADHIYSVLPLHHVHGVVALLNSALWSGAVCEIATKFSATETWAALTRAPDSPQGQLTLFMAVPTVYAMLLEAFDKMPASAQESVRAALRPPASKIRLMVSGSAALPASIAERWADVSGQRLLERYGMTEFAMAISNPLVGERKLNAVGMPLPGYEVRLAAVEPGAPPPVPPEGFAAAGELQLRGLGVFSEYWGKPDATAETFSVDGWFKTGDYGAVDSAGYYHILGRLSADIIKSGGFKISALDIEREMLRSPAVREVAVFGIPDATYGEKIVAVIVPAGADEDAIAAAADALAVPAALSAFSVQLKEFLKDKLPPYKLPGVLKIVPAISRNAMGKINKKALRNELFPAPPQ